VRNGLKRSMTLREKPAIRVAVRAYIERNGTVLVQRKEPSGGPIRFTLPGGGVDPGETLEEGLLRECWEEIGVRVQLVELLHVADSLKPPKAGASEPRQQVELVFRCRLPDDYVPQNGPKPDRNQTAVV
jgi:8-oxo-dGTP diphosphatase